MTSWTDIGSDTKYLVLTNGKLMVYDGVKFFTVDNPEMHKGAPVIKEESKSEPDYNNGEWYKFTFFKFTDFESYCDPLLEEDIFTQDKDYVTKEVVKRMMAKGYDRYYCSKRANGEWYAGPPLCTRDLSLK